MELLAEIREGTISGDNIQLLRERIEVSKPENITQLFPLRSSVDHINKTKYSELQNKEMTYTLAPNYNMERYCRTGAQIDGDMLRKCRGLNAEQRERELGRVYNLSRCMKELTLKKGTYVMCIANIALEQGIANGTQGIVEDFVGVDNAPLIRFNNGTVKTLSRYCWQSEDYPTIGFKQFPVILAWATTIHKMQGSSLDQAIMDLGSNVFEAGQIYVGLSRVKSLEGLYLTKFSPRVIKTNPKVREFYRQLPILEIEVEEVEEEVKEEGEMDEERGIDEEATKPLTKTITLEQRDVLKVVKAEADTTNLSLYEKLKSYRLKTSQEREIPPYCVFTNKTLDDLVEKHPTTLDELKTVTGIGKLKITMYGEDIINICKTVERTTLYEFLNIKLSTGNI